MDLKRLMTDIEYMITDVRTKKFTYNTSSKVPSLSDCDLTYESGYEKKASVLKHVFCLLISETLWS